MTTLSTQSSAHSSIGQGADLQIAASYISHSLSGTAVAATCGPAMPAGGVSYLEVTNNGTASSNITGLTFVYVDMPTNDSGAPTGACTVAVGATEYITLTGIGMDVTGGKDVYTASVTGTNGGFAYTSGILG